VRAARRVIADSAHARDDLRRRFGLVPGQVTTVPLGVDTPEDLETARAMLTNRS